MNILQQSHRLRSFVLMALIGFSLSKSALADPKCPAETWIGTNGSLMMALRSNACHFWNWSATNAKDYFPKELLETSGFVVGDPHHENFAHFFVDNDRVYLPSDLDDSGVAPLFLDFAKFYGVSRSVTLKFGQIDVETALKAYQLGIEGKSFWANQVPALLKADHDVSQEECGSKYLSKIQKNTDDGKFISSDDLTSWDRLTTSQQASFTDLERRFFADALPKGYEIKDRALGMKSGRGGSRGIQRYLYYLKKSKTERHIIEFKQMTTPSVSAYSQQNLSDLNRLEAVLNIYWGSRRPELFRLVGNSSEVYWMRPKYPNFVQFSHDEFSDNPEGFAELTYYISYKLGSWHGRQLRDPAYRLYIRDQFNAIADELNKFTVQYLKVVHSQNGGVK